MRIAARSGFHIKSLAKLSELSQFAIKDAFLFWREYRELSKHHDELHFPLSYWFYAPISTYTCLRDITRLRLSRPMIDDSYRKTLEQIQSRKRWKRPAHDFFYIVSSENAVKLGISSGDGISRIAHHRRHGFHTVNGIWSGLPRRSAEAVERNILRELADMGYEPIKGREYFSISIIDEIMNLSVSCLANYGGYDWRNVEGTPVE